MRRATSSLLRHPLFWLFALFVVIGINLGDRQFLTPAASPDTLSYDFVAQSGTLVEALSSIRTPGYPFFLNLLRPFSPDFRAAPAVHLVLYFAVVVLFWWAVRRYVGSSWLAFAWAAPLAYPCNLGFVRFVQPDFLGPAVAIAALALLVALTTKPSSRPIWLLLTAATFCAYMTRPDNLFLAALLPLGGMVLLLCRRTFEPRRLLRFGAGVLAVAVLPLALYMTVRWSVVGQFGLVPFGGYNLIGVTSSFLDKELVDELPAESRELAARILEARKVRKFQTYRADSWTLKWHKQYSPNVWRIAEPIARELLTEARTTPFQGADLPPMTGAAVFTINRAFKTLSREVILRRPGLYLKWVFQNFQTGLGMVFLCSSFGHLLLLLALSIPAVIFRARRPEPVDPALRDQVLFLIGLSVVVSAYFVARLLLITLVSVPYDRYVLPSMAFLPCVLAASLFGAWRWIVPPRTAR